jgi:uncharacterized protein (UPF0261 family)
MPKVALIATLETKPDETSYLAGAMKALGAEVQVIDASLVSGRVLGGPAKLAAMEQAPARVRDHLQAKLGGLDAVVGIGGGTGGEIILNVLRALPVTFPKVLLTTLPFDPRPALADSSITLVPALSDISGLNPVLRDALDKTAAVTVGLARAPATSSEKRSIAVTSLGATERATARLVAGLQERGEEPTVFHANGYGGAALTRFADNDAFDAIIDLTPHELTRIYLAGVHAPMPGRFSAAPHVPRVVLPGALNFLGLGALDDLSVARRERPHYAHSGLFTHVQLNDAEMVQITRALGQSLNALSGPGAVIVPMGGFSHQDCPGGAIEAPHLRERFLETISVTVESHISVIPVDAHISAADVTHIILTTLTTLMSKTKAYAND